ncbi:MAG: hypothetical protein SNH01_07200 [Rikenellaceae bacterium]
MFGRIKDILRLLLIGVMLLGVTTEVEARKIRVQGVVVDQAGMPINGLDITQEGDDPALGEVWVASTDISGTFIGMIENTKQIHITGGSGYDVWKSVGGDRNVKIVLTENDIKTQMIQAVSVKIPEITVPKKTKAKVVGDKLIIPMGVIIENAWFTQARRIIIAPHIKDVMATDKDSIIYLTPHVLDGEEYRLVDQRKFNFDSLSNPLSQYSRIQKHSTLTKQDLAKKAQDEADAKAKAKALSEKMAQKLRDSIAKVEAAQQAKLQAELDAKAKVEAKKQAELKAEADAKAKIEAKLKAEADAKAAIEAKAQAKLEAEQKAQADAEAKRKAIEDAKAVAADEKAAIEQAKADERARIKAEQDEKLAAQQAAKDDLVTKKQSLAEETAATVAGIQESKEAKITQIAETSKSDIEAYIAKSESEARAEAQKQAAEIAQEATTKAETETQSKVKVLEDAEAKKVAEAQARLDAEAKRLEDAEKAALARLEAEAKAKADKEKAIADAEAKRKEAEAEKAKARAEAAKKKTESKEPKKEEEPAEPKKFKGDELVADAQALVKEAEESMAKVKSEVESKESDVEKAKSKVEEAAKALEANKEDKDLAAAVKSSKSEAVTADKALAKSQSELKAKEKELDKAKDRLKLAESTATKEKERYEADVAAKEKAQKAREELAAKAKEVEAEKAKAAKAEKEKSEKEAKPTKEVAEKRAEEPKVDKAEQVSKSIEEKRAAEQARVDAQLAVVAERKVAEQARVDEAHAKTLTTIEAQRQAAEERIYKKILAEKMAAIKEMELKAKEDIAKAEAEAKEEITKANLGLKESTGASEVEAQQKLADLKAAEKAKADAEAQAKVDAATQAKAQKALDLQFAQGEKGLDSSIDQFMSSIYRESEPISKSKHAELMRKTAALQDTIKVRARNEEKEAAKLAAEAELKAKIEAKTLADEEKAKQQAEEKAKIEKEKAAEKERLEKRRADIKAGKKVNLANSFVVDFTDSVKIINNHGNFIIRINTVIEDYDRKLFSQVSEVAKGTIDPLRFFSYEIDGMPLRDSVLIPKPMMDQHADEGEARISFRVNSTAIDEKDTVSRMELSKITDALISLLTNDDADVKKLSIHGVASPDGPYSKNSVLADKRSAFILEKVRAVVPSDKLSVIKFEHSSSVEGWNTVADKLEKLDSLGKIEAEHIRDMIKKSSSPDKQWAMVRSMPRYKKIISPYILPALRRVEYKIEYSITRLRTVEEVLEVYNTGDPKERAKLFPIDLYNLMLAKKGDKDFREALVYILSVHPELSIVANELACLNIAEGIFDLKVLEPYIKTITPRPIRYNQAINMLRNNMLEPAYKQIYRLPDTPEFEYIRMLVEAKYGEYAKVLPYFSKLGGLNEVLLLLADDRNVTAYQKIISLDHKDDDAIYFYVRALTEFRYSKDQSIDFMVSMNVEMEAVDNAMKAVKLDPKLADMMKVDADMTGLLPLIEQKEKQMEEQQNIESNVVTK